MKKNKDIIIQTRVETEVIEDLKKVLEAEGQERNVSQLLRALIKDFLRVKKNELKLIEV